MMRVVPIRKGSQVILRPKKAVAEGGGNMRQLFALMIFLFGIAGCRGDSSAPGNGGLPPASPDSVPVGGYAYTAYDSLGTPVITGWFSLTINDSIRVRGEWHFRPLVTTGHFGPQTGGDSLFGSFGDGMLFVGLNPDRADDNVFLKGLYDGTTYTGRWEWDTFSGVTSYGTFRGVKRYAPDSNSP
jgi:hypothetical protein